MKNSHFAAALCSALALAFGLATAQAQDAGSLTEAEAYSGNLWFVELSGAPVADGGSLSLARSQKAAFRRAAAAAGIVYTERRSFDVLFNGLSIEASASDRGRIASLSGVKAVYPVEIIQAPDPEVGAGAAPDLATAITMTGADIAQTSLGLTGAGVKVAVMDTGIDIDHPAFGGSGTHGTTAFPSARVTHGYDFVGDAFNADPSSTAYNPTPVPDAVPDDCNGHGSHVAGIVGANGTVTGVAPGVTFGAYRVFGCAGSTTADIMIAAMERALADDMDVLNMSIGSAFQWPQYPTARAADRLVNAGMTVVASIGNSGANGVYSAGAPGLGKKVIGVASFDNIAVTLNQFTISPDNTAIGYSAMTGSVAAPTSGSLPLTKANAVGAVPPGPLPANDGCSAVAPGTYTGMAVLIRRGTCTFALKAQNAQAGGAAAVIIYNNAAGRFAGTIAGSGVTIPTVQISDVEGLLIHNRLAAGAVTMTWQSGVGSFSNPSGNLISSFSSFGLSPDLELKPDIGAPGGLIYSTYPLELGGFATISGTSMSSPHTAGAAALLLQARPGTDSQSVRSILQNSADPRPWFGNPGLGFLDNVHRQGAGMLDIDDAILATTIVEPGKIAAGEGQAGPFAQTLTIRNTGSSAVTYDLSYVNALSTGGVITPSFHTSDASVAFSAASVAVPAGGSATVNATITPASGPANAQYGGYIVLTPQGGGQVYRVPFAGFVGDYQGIQVFTGGFPFLGRLNSCTPAAVLRGLDCFGTGSYSVLPAGGTFNLTAAISQTPYLLVHLDHQVRILRAEVFSTTGKAWHRIFNEDYVGRNSGTTTFFAFPWDGTTFAGNKSYTVPDGTYVVKVSILKALGDAANPAHWETWTSPVITIDRP